MTMTLNKQVFIFALAARALFAVGSVTQSVQPIGLPPSTGPDTRVYVVTLNWTGDSMNGSVPATLLNSLGPFPAVQGMRITSVEIQPGTPNPTVNYSMTLVDGAAVDMFAGAATSLSSTASSSLSISSATSPPLIGAPTFNVTGNAVASAQGKVVIYFAPLAPTNTQTGAALTSSNTFTGTNTFVGLLQCRNFENVQCVDSTLGRGGVDIGDEINRAYAALPAHGGEIWVFPNANDLVYSYSTPIVLATSVKPARLRCFGASTVTPTVAGECVLNYTPTTATAAITLDYGFNGGGSGISQNHGIEDITLINNACVTPGGCGSSASGVKVGNTNGGAGQATFRMRVIGFGTGFDNTSGASPSWGYTFQHSTFTFNTTGLNMGAGAEAMACIHCQFVSNSVHFTATGGDSYFYATSFDGHTSTNGGINLNWNGRASAAKAEFVSCHFEKNNGNTNDNHYIIGNGNYEIIGGVIDIDSTTGNQDFYFQGGGAFTNIIGLEFNSAGQTATQIINSTAGNTAMRGEVQIIFFGLASVPTICGGTGNCSGLIDMSYVADAGNGAPHIWSIEGGVSGPKFNFTETTAPTNSANNDLCYGDSTLHAVKCSYNNGTFFQISQVIGSGMATMTTAAIAAGACGTTVTVAAAGVATTDVIAWAFNAAPAANPAQLVVSAWPTSGNVNFQYCNPTAGSVTPNAATINWRVVR